MATDVSNQQVNEGQRPFLWATEEKILKHTMKGTRTQQNFSSTFPESIRQNKIFFQSDLSSSL